MEADELRRTIEMYWSRIFDYIAVDETYYEIWNRVRQFNSDVPGENLVKLAVREVVENKLSKILDEM